MAGQGKELEAGQSMFVAKYSVHQIVKGDGYEDDYESMREIHASNLAEAEARARELAPYLGYEDEHVSKSYTFLYVAPGHLDGLRDSDDIEPTTTAE